MSWMIIFWKKPCEENELLDEILRDYQIVKEKQKICLKGDIIIVKSERTLELGNFRSGVEFYADELDEIEKIIVNNQRFITVENKTSYMRCREADTSYFYLGGYANRFQRDFLKMIYRDNPGVRYFHFGDIDAGGFSILLDLREKTGIPFMSYHMDLDTLKQYRQYGKCQKNPGSNY